MIWHRQFFFVILLAGWIPHCAGIPGDTALQKNTFVILGSRLHGGYIIKHSKKIRHLPDAYPRGLEIILGWQFTSRKAFDYCHCYPRTGLIIEHFDYNQPSILGRGFLLMHFVEPFFGAGRKLGFSIRGGYGLGYLTMPFDEVDNPDNLSYSARINFPLTLGASIHCRLSPKVLISLTMNYNHVSNAGVSEPNLGINYPTLSMGIDYWLHTPMYRFREAADWREKGIRKRTDITLSQGRRQIDHSEKERYFIFGVSVLHHRQVGRISALHGGAEWLMDGAVQEKIRRKTISGTGSESFNLLAGHEFLLGKFLFSQTLGLYIYKPYDYGDAVYQRYGLMFRFHETALLGVSLKAHRHVADYLDIRLSLTF